MLDPASSSTIHEADPRDPAPSATDAGVATLQRLNSAAPASLVSRARRARLVGERKPVTAVFADIVDSTALAERIDPEEWTLLINAAFDEMSRHIFAFEGTIAQLQGDALISFFGAPVTHEDDPERAVRAALAMTRAMEAYGDEVRRSHRLDFRIRVGISTGVVLVGNVGSDLRYDYTAIGDTMNLASRLEGAARPGSILISDRTERHVRPWFDLEDVGLLELKGKSDGVRAFRVLGERATPGSARGIEGLDSPLVGRDAELAVLTGLVATVEAGLGRSALVIAEPGLGKSRLITELRTRTDRREPAPAQEMAWVVAASSSYGARMPFHHVVSLLHGLLGSTPANTAEEVERAMRTLVERMLPGDDAAVGYLTLLMGIANEEGTSGSGRTSGEFLADRLVATVLRLLHEIARQGPIGIVVEDLHWSDPASVELFKAILTITDASPVLLVFTSRDEPASAGWDLVRTARERSGPGLQEIRLRPLDGDDTRALVANLLAIESLPSRTRELILEKAEGNPFFVEEVIRMLIDQGAIRREGDRWHATRTVADASIPDTLQGLILARIDRLEDAARRVLRLASCIDRRFSVPLLEDVAREMGIAEGLGAALARLEAAGVIVLAGTDPDLEYRFSHALVQDAAYETVLHQERRTWHARIAAALLARFAGREEELADRLARHFELAGDTDRAVDYLLLAADRALARNAMVDAGALYAHADELVGGADDVGGAPAEDRARAADGDRVRESGDNQARAGARAHDARRAHQRLRVLLGRLASGLDLMEPDEAFDLLAEGRRIAERLEDTASLSDLLFWEMALRHLRGERPETSDELRELSERIESSGEVAGSEIQQAQALARSGIFMYWAGDLDRSQRALARAGELFRRNGDDIGVAMVTAYEAAGLAARGDFEAADRAMEGSRAHAERADALAKLDFHLAEAALAALRGDHSRSARYANECLEGSMGIGAISCATVSGIVLGGSQLALGDIDEAKRSVERSLDLSRLPTLAPMRVRGHVVLATAHGADGDFARADDGFANVLRTIIATGGTYGQAEVRLARGRLLAMHPDGDAHAALEDLEAAAETFAAIGARPALARAMRARGIAQARLGQTELADASLAEAAEMAGAMGLLDGPWPRSSLELEAARAASSPLQPVD